MKRKSITVILGSIIVFCSIFFFVRKYEFGGIIMSVVGASLIYLGLNPGRTGIVVFGHICIAMGCFLTTWGIYLLPYSQPKLEHIIFRPLFWGLFSIFGGICAIYHGFCRCVRRGYAEPKMDQCTK